MDEASEVLRSPYSKSTNRCHNFQVFSEIKLPFQRPLLRRQLLPRLLQVSILPIERYDTPYLLISLNLWHRFVDLLYDSVGWFSSGPSGVTKKARPATQAQIVRL